MRVKFLDIYYPRQEVYVFIRVCMSIISKVSNILLRKFDGLDDIAYCMD
jgi:hypothetical protein